MPPNATSAAAGGGTRRRTISLAKKLLPPAALVCLVVIAYNRHLGKDAKADGGGGVEHLHGVQHVSQSPRGWTEWTGRTATAHAGHGTAEEEEADAAAEEQRGGDGDDEHTAAHARFGDKSSSSAKKANIAGVDVDGTTSGGGEEAFRTVKGVDAGALSTSPPPPPPPPPPPRVATRGTHACSREYLPHMPEARACCKAPHSSSKPFARPFVNADTLLASAPSKTATGRAIEPETWFSSRRIMKGQAAGFGAGEGRQRAQHSTFTGSWSTCAVVGNSGHLLKGTKHGADIDGHDVVMRINQAPTEGYAQFVVGQRTSCESS
jgi:hypothetical protein